MGKAKMIQQQNKKSSALKIYGINLQAKSTREILVPTVADVWGKASQWKKLSRARVWFSALVKACFKLHNHLPC